MDRVVGVDVSKAQLDAYELGAGQRLQVDDMLPGSPDWRPGRAPARSW